MKKWKVTNNTFQPVQAIGVAYTFPTIAAAAEFFNTGRNGVTKALETGGLCKGYWFRYSDMPPSCQPLKNPYTKAIIRDDGEAFTSIASVVNAYFIDGNPARHRYNAAWMALKRAIERGQPWKGNRYRYLAATDVMPNQNGFPPPLSHTPKTDPAECGGEAA